MKLALAILVFLAARDVHSFMLPRRLVHQEGDSQEFLALPTAIERRAHGHKGNPGSVPKRPPVPPHPRPPPAHAPPAKHRPGPAPTTSKPVMAHKPTHTKPAKPSATRPVRTHAPKPAKPTRTPRPTKTPANGQKTSRTRTHLLTTIPTKQPLPSTAVQVSTPAKGVPRTTSAPTHGAGCPKVIGGINTHSSTPGGAVTTVSKTADGPAPTRSAVACSKPPSGFGGTKAGFSDLCAGVRYCDPAETDKMDWQGPDGEVTRREIETLLGDLQGTGTHLKNGQDNALSDGWMGLASYGAGLLFEITGDRRALDVAVRIADNMVATRNDPNTGRVMWTGKREPIWPTKPEAKNTAPYYGCESMHVVGHMVNVAIYILKTPCLWNQRPQLTSGPTAFDASATYLDRAKAYIATGDSTVEQAYLPYYFTSAGLLIAPNDPRYAAAHDFPPGVWMPWNRRSMVLHGLMKLAAAHSLDPVRDTARQQKYDGLVDANVRDFISALNHTTSRGFDTYSWTYARKPPGGSIEMVNGIHAFYDVWGLYMAWQHGSAPDALTDSVMLNFANTMQHQIFSDDGSGNFAAYVSGESNPCNSKEAPRKSVWGAWSFYGKFLPEWYRTVAIADAGQMAATWTSSTLLWTKAALYRNNDAFWRGQLS